MIVVGGGAQDASESVRTFAELLQAPVTTRRMGQGVIPTAHELFAPLAVGHRLWADADLVIGIGTRLEWPLQHWKTDDHQTIVKIDIDADELDRHEVGTIGVHGDADDVCRALVEALGPAGRRPDRADELARMNDEYRRTDRSSPSATRLSRCHP